MSDIRHEERPPAAPMLRAGALDLPGLTHGFFTRAGGVSKGLYASLNGGLGSNDDPAAVAENHARMARALGLERGRLLVPYQVHSADVACVAAPWPAGERPRVDGLVTDVAGLAIGVTGADCAHGAASPMRRRVSSASPTPAGKGRSPAFSKRPSRPWSGSARRATAITAVLGPTIGPRSYAVGPEFCARFLDHSPGNARFFAGGTFDLPGYIAMRLRAAGIGQFADLALDTYADEARFFSYRRSFHRREADYGRLVAAIALV